MGWPHVWGASSAYLAGWRVVCVAQPRHKVAQLWCRRCEQWLQVLWSHSNSWGFHCVVGGNVYECLSWGVSVVLAYNHAMAHTSHMNSRHYL